MFRVATAPLYRYRPPTAADALIVTHERLTSNQVRTRLHALHKRALASRFTTHWVRVELSTILIMYAFKISIQFWSRRDNGVVPLADACSVSATPVLGTDTTSCCRAQRTNGRHWVRVELSTILIKYAFKISIQFWSRRDNSVVPLA